MLNRFILTVILLLFVNILSAQKIPDSITIDEALSLQRVQGSAAPLATNDGASTELPAPFRPPFISINPIRLFDNLYFVGTTAVGSFIVDSGDGFVMFDTGNGDSDAAMMVEDMKKLGIDPSKIKLIFISHEHFDHYGGVQYLKKNICPDARVAMSLVGWNMLQSVAFESPYNGTRPQKVDIFLADGMRIRVGKETIRIVATPGHSPGCVSFIFPVTDNGVTHMAGLMGGSAVWPTQVETYLYKSSVEYFKAFASDAKCDVGLFFHSQEGDFSALHLRKPGEANPLVLGTEKFNTVYLESFRNRYRQMLKVLSEHKQQ
jgi:metallo-beta-lactamase class B